MAYVPRYSMKVIQGHLGSAPAFLLMVVGLTYRFSGWSDIMFTGIKKETLANLASLRIFICNFYLK